MLIAITQLKVEDRGKTVFSTVCDAAVTLLFLVLRKQEEILNTPIFFSKVCGGVVAVLVLSLAATLTSTVRNARETP
jgi:hypothetical protein